MADEPDNSYAQTMLDASRAGAEFVLADLSLAMTLLERAASTEDPDTRKRNIQNALNAYTTALGFSSRLALTTTERRTMNEQIALLKTKLEAFGEQL